MERDEHIYAYVMNELEHGVKNDALWIKAYAIVEGWEQKIEPKYMQYRVEEIKQNFIKNNIDYTEFSKDELFESIRKDFAPHWMLHLWKWADEYKVLEYGEHVFFEWRDKIRWPQTCGLPRDKETLLSLKKLDLCSSELLSGSKADVFSKTYNTFIFLPTEICNLKNLLELDINNNKLVKLPKKIINLTNLKYLNLANNDLQLSQSQKDWIRLLDSKGCNIESSFV